MLRLQLTQRRRVTLEIGVSGFRIKNERAHSILLARRIEVEHIDLLLGGLQRVDRIARDLVVEHPLPELRGLDGHDLVMQPDRLAPGRVERIGHRSCITARQKARDFRQLGIE